MSDILVLSSAYTPDPNQWAPFRLSCEKHGVPLHVFGLCDEYPTYPGMDGFKRGIEFLQSRSEEYIVLTDAFDVLCNRWDEDEVRMIIDSAPNLVMSVEPLVWPVGCPDTYPDPKRYKWRAINGGQYAGRRIDMIDVWKCILGHWQDGWATLGGSSQEILHRMHAHYPWPFTLDLECRLFQSMLGENAKYVWAMPETMPETIVQRAHAWNSITHSTPMFLHFNGSGLNLSPGMQEWASLLI